MSGWQRIGVVISVLWILAAPSYFVISSYQDAGAYYRRCLGRIPDSDTKPEDVGKAMQDCATEERRMVASPARFMQILLFQEDSFEGLLSWGIILVPIAIFWIIGGIVLATLRWIGRGFVRSGK
jgi:hypothetical protein